MDYYNFFSFSAKKAIYRASEICQQFSNQFLDPEHIFYALLQLRSSSAVQVLQQLSTHLPRLTYELETYLQEHAGEYLGQPSFSARTLALLDASFREVKRLHHREIGTAHVLLALAQEHSAFIRQLRDEHRLDAQMIRYIFMKHLMGYEAGIELPPEEPEPRQPRGWPGAMLTQYFPQRMQSAADQPEPARRARMTWPRFPTPPEHENTVTRSSRAVLDLAMETAMAFRGREIYPEHVLYAIIQTRTCGANKLLNGLGVSFPLLRDKIAMYISTAGERTAGNLQPLTGKRICKLIVDAMAEAQRYGHEVIGTPHLLTAILAEPDTPCLEDITGTLGLTAALIRSVLSYSPLAEEEAGPAGPTPGPDTSPV